MAEMEGNKEEAEEEEEVDVYIDPLTFKINDDITLNQLEILHIYACVHWAKKYNGERWKESEIKDLIGHTMLKLDDDKYKKFDLSNLFKTFRNRDDPDTIKAEDRAEDIQNILLAQIERLEISPSFVGLFLTDCECRLAYLRKNESLIREKARDEPPQHPSIEEVWAGSSGVNVHEVRLAYQRVHDSLIREERRKHDSLVREERRNNNPLYPSIEKVLAGPSKGSQGRQGQGKK